MNKVEGRQREDLGAGVLARCDLEMPDSSCLWFHAEWILPTEQRLL